MHIQDLNGVHRHQALAWLEAIADNLRASDLDEMIATTPVAHPDPFFSLVASFIWSDETYVILDGDEPICVFGVVDLDHEGCVWMLGTDGMQRRHAARFIAIRTRQYLDRFHERFDRLANYVDARNVLSIRWLLANGFEIESVDLAHGRQRLPFFLFSSTRRPTPSVTP